MTARTIEGWTALASGLLLAVAIAGSALVTGVTGNVNPTTFNWMTDTLVNPSENGTPHDLTVPALGIHIVAGAGETKTVGLRSLAAGRYDAYCSVPGHADRGMRATVVVR